MLAPSLPASGLELCSSRHSNFALDRTGTDSAEAERCSLQHVYQTDTYERAGGSKLPATLVILTTQAADQGRAPASLCLASRLYSNSFFCRLSKAECSLTPSGMLTCRTVGRSQHWSASSDGVRRAARQQLHSEVTEWLVLWPRTGWLVFDFREGQHFSLPH